MITSFRKIRQKLLSENLPAGRKGKFSKYLLYAIGEIVLVVIGILIALSINNWNEKNKLESKKQDYYLQLLDDLKKDETATKQTIIKFDNYLKEFQNYTNTYESDVLTPPKVYEMISKLPVLSTRITFNTSTLESLQSSGDIGLMPSKIRNRLIDLKREQDLTIKHADYTDDGKNGIIQNLNPLLGSTTLPDRLKNQPELSEFFNIDENLKELILVYEGVHRWKSISEQQSKIRLENVLKEMDTIVALINKELK
ncbi:DUF6090 family protein [Gaetbulibacter sp. M240]|uniref:DUF6090 family protein n=1 Tax=Gaetbulibacter sp. M240 TaxID=3126511 RepID=UPI00374E6B40